MIVPTKHIDALKTPAASAAVKFARESCPLNPNTAAATVSPAREEEILTFGVQTSVREVARLAAAQRAKDRPAAVGPPAQPATEKQTQANGSKRTIAAQSSTSEEQSSSSQDSADKGESSGSAEESSSAESDSSSEEEEQHDAAMKEENLSARHILNSRPATGESPDIPMANKSSLDQILAQRCQEALSCKAKNQPGPAKALLSPEVCERLPVMSAGAQQVGMILAYRLLELSATFCPEVSEWRAGSVESVSPFVLAPWPEQEPIADRSHRQDPCDDIAAEEESESPPSAYDENGRLNGDEHSFVDIRVFGQDDADARSRLSLTQGAVSQGLIIESSSPAVAVKDRVPTSPVVAGNGSRAGVLAMPPARLASQPHATQGTKESASPPEICRNESPGRHQTPGQIVSVTGGWAALAEELAAKKKALAATIYQPGDESLKADGVRTPGAVRPRGGVRSTAIGPMLAMLRSSGVDEAIDVEQ
eukprot:scaffold105791_cov34-Prasinocladus_malaysianus.AAC.2